MREAPAAFGRLCVETDKKGRALIRFGPAAFGRLCVETQLPCVVVYIDGPAAFGRLCVETFFLGDMLLNESDQPPSGGCVLKPRSFLFSGLAEITSRLRAAVC